MVLDGPDRDVVAVAERSREAASARLTAQGSTHARLERAEALALAEAAMASAAVLTVARSAGPVGPPATETAVPDPAADELRAAVDVLSRAVPAPVTVVHNGHAPPPDESTESVRAAAAVVFALSVEEDLAARPSATADLASAQAALAEVEAGLADASASATRVTSTVLEPVASAPVGPTTAGTVDPWPNGEIPLELLCSPAVAPDALLRCDAAAALDLLNAAYRAELGRDLDVVSSYRSVEQQVAVKAARGWLAATPGTSNHGRGIAVDLGGFGSVGDFSSASYRWMEGHAHEFGWFHPEYMKAGGSGPPEPWHWEYGG